MKVSLFGDFQNEGVLQLEQTLRMRGVEVERVDNPSTVRGICLVCFSSSEGFQSQDFSLSILGRKWKGENIALFPILFQGGQIPYLLSDFRPVDLRKKEDEEDQMDLLMRSIKARS